jgi:hypothetical protein
MLRVSSEKVKIVILNAFFVEPIYIYIYIYRERERERERCECVCLCVWFSCHKTCLLE